MGCGLALSYYFNLWFNVPPLLKATLLDFRITWPSQVILIGLADLGNWQVQAEKLYFTFIVKKSRAKFKVIHYKSWETCSQLNEK